MNFLFGNVFWGVLLLLWGISLILKGLNIVDLPLVKIFIAIIIIMFGIRLLVGGSHHVKVFSGKQGVYTSGGTEYTAVFSNQTVDLTDISPNSKSLDITAVFGSIYVILPDDIDFAITPTGVFGTANAPKPPANRPTALGSVEIEATAVFGQVEFEYKPSHRKAGIAGAAADSTGGSPSDSL